MARGLQVHPNMMQNKLYSRCFTLSFALLASFFIAGCTTSKTTTTARSATEQLLLSTATDHALLGNGLDSFSGKKVFLDGSYFDSVDSKYVLGSVRDAISRAGAVIVDTASNSDIIIEARSGSLAINQSDTLFGIPSFGVPIPLAGMIQTPEIAFYKSEKQRSYAKFALLALAKPTGAHVYSSGPLDGKSYHMHFRFLFVSWFRTDIPEAAKTKEKEDKLQTWAPQYDLQNIGTNAPAK